MTKTKRQPKKKQIDTHDLNLPEFLGDLIRDRSLYGVLDSLAEALDSRADHYREEFAKPEHQHWSVQSLYEEEIEFCEAAAGDIRIAREMLESEWEGRAPTFADGKFWGPPNNRFKEASRKHFDGLFATLKDPNAPEDAKRQAAAELASDGEGTIWYNLKTGQPDFEIAKLFQKTTAAINDPATPEDEKLEMIEAVEDLLSQRCP